MINCTVCGLPYQEGRAERHRSTYSHRSALGTGAPRPRRRAARQAQTRSARAPRRQARPRRARSETAGIIQTAETGAENFGQRMARIRAEKAAAADQAGG